MADIKYAMASSVPQGRGPEMARRCSSHLPSGTGAAAVAAGSAPGAGTGSAGSPGSSPGGVGEGEGGERIRRRGSE
jgi:hypothetical protein